MRSSVSQMQPQAGNPEETETVNVAEILESIQLPVAITPMDEEFDQLYHQDSVDVAPQARETSDLIQTAAETAGIFQSVTSLNNDITVSQRLVSETLSSSTISTSATSLPTSTSVLLTAATSESVTAVAASSAPVASVSLKPVDRPLASTLTMEPNPLLHVDIEVGELIDSDLEDDVPNEPKSNPVKDNSGGLKRHYDRDSRCVAGRPHRNYDKENRVPRNDRRDSYQHKSFQRGGARARPSPYDRRSSNARKYNGYNSSQRNDGVTISNADYRMFCDVMRHRN